METKKSTFSRLDELEGAQESIPQLPMKWHYIYCFVVLPVCAVFSGFFAVAFSRIILISFYSDINKIALSFFLMYSFSAIGAVINIFRL